MKKKFLSLTLAMSMMTTMGATVFASDDNTVVEANNEVVSSTSVATLEVGVEQTFVNEDGTEIKYFLDENLMPYNYDVNQVKTALLLPLDHLRVTDQDIIDEHEKNQVSSRFLFNSVEILSTKVYSSSYTSNYLNILLSENAFNVNTSGASKIIMTTYVSYIENNELKVFGYKYPSYNLNSGTSFKFQSITTNVVGLVLKLDSENYTGSYGLTVKAGNAIN